MSRIDLGLKGSLHHRVDDHGDVEVWVRDYGMSAAHQDEVWLKWRAGESFSAIARSLGLPLQHVRRFLAQTGGVRRPPPRRRIQHLTMAEREEISRGLAMGCSARTIATRIRRSPSTIAREIARNGGRTSYRAATADEQAYQRARRPKPARLAKNPLFVHWSRKNSRPAGRLSRSSAGCAISSTTTSR